MEAKLREVTSQTVLKVSITVAGHAMATRRLIFARSSEEAVVQPDGRVVPKDVERPCAPFTR